MPWPALCLIVLLPWATPGSYMFWKTPYVIMSSFSQLTAA
jgi:hypothetical protein